MSQPLRYLAPNVLTVARLIAAIAFPWLPEPWRLPVIVGALLSDFTDGALSRLLRAESGFGRVVDPIADKSFAASVALTYVIEGGLHWAQILLVLARDLLVLAGAAFFFVRDGWTSLSCMKSRFLGKLTTVFQFGFFLAVLCDLGALENVFLIAALVAGVLAAVDYFWSYQGRLAQALSAGRPHSELQRCTT